MLEHTQIERHDDGSWVGAGVRVGITVQKGGRLFKRRAMKPWAPEGGRHECMLVGELKGVRAYIVERDGQPRIVLTESDLYPEFE